MSQLARRWLPPLLILALAVVGWEIAVRVRETPEWFLPPPSAIAGELWRERSLFARHTWVTLRAIVLGFGLGLAFGVGLGIAIDGSRVVERALYPIVIASQAVPIVALAPLLLVWFGYGLAPKLVVTALVVFFPIVVSTVDGLRGVDSELLALLRTFRAGRWARFRLAKAPSALPSVFSGARIGVALAVIGAVFGEYVGAKAGLGYLMDVSAARLLTARVFACITILASLAILLFVAVSVLERLVMPWRRYEREA
jgi:ABC-type nitrate/sulfonate/bicarbonate transport system permease component